MMKESVYTRLDRETTKKIDNLVKTKKFDSRASFIRRAVIDKLEEFDQRILA